MAFYNGSCNDVNQLLTAVNNACIANGWILSDGILSKQNCFVQLYTSGSILYLIGGNGQKGSSLTDSPKLSNGRLLAANLGGVTYPLTYNIHVMDREVYLFVNYNVDFWSYLAFGQSGVKGLPGTGNWYGGLYPISNSSIGRGGHPCCLLFSAFATSGTIGNTGQQIGWFFHHGLDDYPWSISGDNVGDINNNGWSSLPSQAVATKMVEPLLVRQPNSWNNEAILLNISPAIYRPEGRLSVVGDLKHARYIRNTYYNDGQIITLGQDKWRVYPCIRKNTTNPEPYHSNQHSGTYAIAVRYEGD